MIDFGLDKTANGRILNKSASYCRIRFYLIKRPKKCKKKFIGFQQRLWNNDHLVGEDVAREIQDNLPGICFA